MDIRDCLNKRDLIRINPDNDLIEKEIKESNYDFEKANKAYSEGDMKWATVKAYYSMFHIAKALLFKLGLREKKHYAILIVLEDLNKKGRLESKFVDYYDSAMSSREDADYRYYYPKESAEHSLEIAKEFRERIIKLIKDIKIKI